MMNFLQIRIMIVIAVLTGVDSFPCENKSCSGLGFSTIDNYKLIRFQCSVRQSIFGNFNTASLCDDSEESIFSTRLRKFAEKRGHYLIFCDKSYDVTLIFLSLLKEHDY